MLFRSKRLGHSSADTEGGAANPEEATQTGRQEDKRGGRVRKAAGGKLSEMEWEHSKKDLQQDRKLAKKHGMSMEKWEKSALDKKHDKQQSTEGLKKGGRAYRKDGGPVNGRGKTTVNIVVGAGRQQPDGGMGAGNIAPVPGIPVGTRPPAPPMQQPPMAPPMMAAPMAAPPMAPPPAAPMGGAPGMPPRPFKRGGKVSTYHDLTAGAGSGEGRLEKIELQQSMKGKRP